MSCRLEAFADGLGDKNRRNNIARAAEGMNGRIFYRAKQYLHLICTVQLRQKMDTQEALRLQSGKGREMVVGGGVCQVTTTLYNAVLRAELEVAYRKNHSMMVNYVYPGMDAMVAPQG